MKIACQYAIVRFLPFLETGEFANVGVILFAPKTRFLGYKLAPKAFPRVTRFFNELDAAVYRKAIRGFDTELEEVQKLAIGQTSDDLILFAKEVTRLRESLLRFSELRTVLTDNPQEELEALYARYVGRDFINQEYRENVMTRTIKKQLADCNLEKLYVKYTFKKDLRKVTLPLVNSNPEITRVMKPLAFDQKDPSKLIEHAELWRNKLDWLLQRGVLKNENILLPIEKPEDTTSSELQEAYNIVAEDLKALHIEMIDFDNTARIMEFAREGLPPDIYH